MAKTEAVKEILSTKYEKQGNTKVLSTPKGLSNVEIQVRVRYIADGLLSEKWVGWYCKAFIILGEGRFTAVANTAKSGKNPVTLFGWLLKQEMAK